MIENILRNKSDCRGLAKVLLQKKLQRELVLAHIHLWIGNEAWYQVNTRKVFCQKS